ncbi:MAG: DUF1016 domain-containing protein, partial [Dysgonamonadaceae bacterium]|nr:DUF1016 domain-containing protein [Dysgonamonadaceae bacterium]
MDADSKATLKDPYKFDFIVLTENNKEKELEDALVTNITKFLLELGQGFAYVGRQYPIQVENREQNIDLLFYHLELRCYVVIELKVNNQLKKDIDNPTIGLIIVKEKDNIDAQYSLESSSQPIGISEYTLSNIVARNFKSSLPFIEEIERTLNKEEEMNSHDAVWLSKDFEFGCVRCSCITDKTLTAGHLIRNTLRKSNLRYKINQPPSKQ